MQLADTARPLRRLRPRRAAPAMAYPRQARPDQRLRRPVPMTVALPLSGMWVPTAENRPDDPRSWQNEPGPGADEPAEAEIVHRSIRALEVVPRVRVP